MASITGKPVKHRSVVSSFIFKTGKLDKSDQDQCLVALFRRSQHPNIRSYQGKLAPIAGSIDQSDANAIAAAAREVHEETHLVVDKHISVAFCGKPFSFVDEEAGRSWTVHPFGWQLIRSDAEMEIKIDWEHEGWEWVPPEKVLNGEMKEKCVPNLDQSLKRVYFGPNGMFPGNWILRDNQAGIAFAKGIERLRTDKENGARVLATAAVTCLQAIVKCTWDDIETDKDHPAAGDGMEWWTALRIAAWQLIYSGRPSMNAAISSAILHALRSVKSNIEFQRLNGEVMAQVYKQFSDCISEREHATARISQAFRDFTKLLISELNKNEPEVNTLTAIDIITLSSSSTICASLLNTLKDIPNLHINLQILESRPLCEGASLATALIKAVDQENGSVRSRLHITVAPDSHSAYLVQQYNLKRDNKRPSILLLGADRISPSGHVSNKMGSFASAIIVKSLSPGTQVVVLSEGDKITKSSEANLQGTSEGKEDYDNKKEMAEHSPESNDPKEVTRIWEDAGAGKNVLDMFSTRSSTPGDEMNVDLKVENVYFEWVPTKYIDKYVSEEGTVDRDRIKEKSLAKGRLEVEIFDDLYNNS